MMALLAALPAAGCRDRGGKARGTDAAGGERASAAAKAPWQARCGPALQSLARLPAEQRVAAILDACPVCEAGPLLVDRRDLKRTPSYLHELEAALEGCGGFCDQASRKDFLRGIMHQADEKEFSSRPWRQLAEACPLELGSRDDTRNFVGATWFFLERIAHAAGRELPAALGATAPFPLPAVAEGGRGLLLPPAPAQPAAPLSTPGRLAVTVFVQQTLVGRLPWARLAAAGVSVDGDYPGQRADEPAAALAEQEKLLAGLPDGPDAALPVTLLAPAGLPARRLAEVLQQLGRPARLAVMPPSTLPEYAPPMALPAELTAVSGQPPAATELRLDAAALDAALTAAAALPAGAKVRLVASVDVTTAQLAEVLARLPATATAQLVADPSAPAAPTAPAAPAKPTK